MSEKLTWESFPRKKDRIAIVGFALNSRPYIPWQDPDLEIFSLNEGYNFGWIERWDRWLQIHPRWDFMRNTNLNDPNHFLWLKNESGPCITCKQTGKVVPVQDAERKQIVCPSCNGTGKYNPPASRMDPSFPIYMQKRHDDIPNSVALPIGEIIKNLIPEMNNQLDYFTSSFAFMFGLSVLMGYKRIELYGFEMGAQTEYAYQRAGAEYLIGLAQGKGVEVYIPKQSTLLQGPMYAYKHMKQGYRQNLEMRGQFLTKQLDEERSRMNVLVGHVQAFEQIAEEQKKEPEKPVNIGALMQNAYSDKEKQLGLMNGIRFAIEEVNNLTKMYDNYFWTGTEGGDEDETQMIPNEVTQHISVRYQAAK